MPECSPVTWPLVHPEASPRLRAPKEHQDKENGVVGTEGHLATMEEDAAGTPIDEQPQRPSCLDSPDRSNSWELSISRDV